MARTYRRLAAAFARYKERDDPTPVQIGIVGGGNISETHIRAAREIDGVEIAAIHRRNRKKCERLELYGGAPYDDFETFLEHRDLDNVLERGVES